MTKIKVLLVVLLLVFSNVSSFFVSVPTGNVMVTYHMRVLQNETSGAGLNFFNAITSTYQIVDTTSQKDRIPMIKCVSKDKQEVTFPGIEVWNQLPESQVYKVLKTFEKKYNNPPVPYDTALIFEPVTNFIKETCSEYTGEQLRTDQYKHINEWVKNYLQDFQKNRPELNGDDTGLIILKVFVDIPRLSKQVEANHEEIAIQKTRRQAEEARQEAEMKEKETKNKIEILEAEKVRDVASVENDQRVRKEETEARVAKVRADSEADQKRIQADANSYAAHKEATDNQVLLTKEYLTLKQLETFGSNKVIYYGDKIPSYLSNPYINSQVSYDVEK